MSIGIFHNQKNLIFGKTKKAKLKNLEINQREYGNTFILILCFFFVLLKRRINNGNKINVLLNKLKNEIMNHALTRNS